MERFIVLLVCFTCILTLASGAVKAQQHIPDAGILLQEQRQPSATLPDRLPTDREKEITAPPL